MRRSTSRIVVRRTSAAFGGRIPRARALVLLALQAMLWIAGPIVDGIQDASSARTQVHVELLGGTKCTPVHSALDCLICRTLGQGAEVPPAQQLITNRKTDGVACRHTTTQRLVGARSGALGSRAPPSA
ncbi:MAG: hypothetical protein U0132_03245 [Gemmatimonadaceae bacterium]